MLILLKLTVLQIYFRVLCSYNINNNNNNNKRLNFILPHKQQKYLSIL